MVKQEPAAAGWEGWKSLLDLKSLLPEGVTLPAPNPDPNYVPTPPKPTLKNISPTGSTAIEFNEDVFIYQNLKNLTFSKPAAAEQKRDL